LNSEGPQRDETHPLLSFAALASMAFASVSSCPFLVFVVRHRLREIAAILIVLENTLPIHAPVHDVIAKGSLEYPG